MIRFTPVHWLTTCSCLLFFSTTWNSEAGQVAVKPLQGCFVKKYAKGASAGDYSWIRVSIDLRPKNIGIDSPNPNSFDEPIEVELWYSHWSLPRASLGPNWHCGASGARISCSVECDGGGASLRPLVNGDLLLDAHVMVEEARGLGSVL
jgi:hypothetical protein